jgi:hypothetical protein
MQMQQISTRAHIKNYSKIIDTMKDIEIRFLKIKCSQEYKMSPQLKDSVDSLDYALYTLKQLLQLTEKALRNTGPNDGASHQEVIDSIIDDADKRWTHVK